MFLLKFALRFLGNFVWKIVAGVFGWLVWTAIGLVMVFSIVGFPIAKKCFKIAYFIYKPFGKEVVLNAFRYPLLNLIWGLSFGVVFGLTAFFNVLLFAVSLIGLPIAKQWYKVAKLSMFPFGAYISR